MLRSLVPLLLGAAAACGFDLRARRLGLSPPGFREPARRAAATTLLAIVLALAVFQPLASLGRPAPEIDFGAIPAWQLFLVHLLMTGGLLAWWACGFLGLPRGEWGSLAAQVGLRAPSPPREIGLGLVIGLASWVAVIAAVVLVAMAAAALGGDHWIPSRPPPAIPWMAGLPIALRAALALSAGVVEEVFFRGLLQPRIGLLASTALFALAHLSYDQPFMLVGVTLLSIVYGLVARWRQSIWAPIAAHFLFDAIQLLIVIPAVLRQFPAGVP